MMTLELVVFLTILIRSTTSLLAYDCGGKEINVTTVSLLDVGDCDIPSIDIKTEEKSIQLLQVIDYHETEVIQCKLEITRIIYKCGYWGHLMPVDHSLRSYIYETSRDACKQMHITGVYKFTDNHIISDLSVNKTRQYSLNFAGKVDGKNCKGASYSDSYGTYEDVLVQGHIDVTLQSYKSQISLKNDKIHLRSGVTCRYSDTNCLDQEGGYTFWTPLPEDRCNFNKYSVIYSGLATKVTDLELNNNIQVMYSMVSEDTMFALVKRGSENICGHNIIRTEHPKLFIFETTGGSVFNHDKLSVQNMDIFTYVNSKFIYVERHIRKQMKDIYLDLIRQMSPGTGNN